MTCKLFIPSSLQIIKPKENFFSSAIIYFSIKTSKTFPAPKAFLLLDSLQLSHIPDPIVIIRGSCVNIRITERAIGSDPTSNPNADLVNNDRSAAITATDSPASWIEHANVAVENPHRVKWIIAIKSSTVRICHRFHLKILLNICSRLNPRLTKTNHRRCYVSPQSIRHKSYRHHHRPESDFLDRFNQSHAGRKIYLIEDRVCLSLTHSCRTVS
jgi:hypothetical protein